MSGAETKSGAEPNAETGAAAGRKAGGRALVAIALFLALLVALNLAVPDRAYLVVKASHVVAMVAWMAGLLYLPRLFVYHADVPSGSDRAATFAVMEARLLKVIMTPAMLVTWVLGLWLATTGGWWGAWWLWAKIVAVVGLTACHMHFAVAAKRFAWGEETRSARHWRMVNEVPTVLMLAAIALVIVAKDW